MTLYAVLLAWSLIGQLSAGAGPETGACAAVMATGLSGSAAEICLGDDQVRQASTAKENRDRLRLLETAAQHYRRAVTLGSNTETKAQALNALAETYDAKHLNQLGQMEETLRELVALQPNEVTYLFRLARVQEDQKLMASAEDTLLGARREHPDAVDVYMMLAQFYSRRALALRQEGDAKKAQEVATSPGEPDENGVYKVGGTVSAPARVGTPQYPPDALAAGIQGVVIAEIVVNEAGNVADAKILRSVPLLDEAALQAVRAWQYAPTIINGQAVPVKMTVTVNFSRSPSSQSAPQPPRQ
jgi:TonB family protein